MKTASVLCGALLAIGLSCQAAQPDFRFQGTVVYVDDGDTLVMLDADHQQHKIRLTDVDAPEADHTGQNRGRVGQPYSRASGRNLANMAKGRMAEAICYEKDRYGRSVCRVLVDGIDVSLEQIRAGMGWANRANKRYVRDMRAFKYEEEARVARRGLWADANPIEPWLWHRVCWEQGNCAGAGE